MTVKIQLLTAASVTLLFLSSCQKDLVVAPEETLQAETVANDATAANNAIETSAPVWTSVVQSVNSNVAGYWQGVPAKYNSTTKKYPLILFIHGIGELGTKLSRMNCCGLPHHMRNGSFPANFNVGGTNYSFIVIAPQFKVRPNAAQMQSVIDFARRKWRIDETRIYVTGLSMGGGSTWDYSAVYGQNAAAIVPVCGGTKPSTSMAASIASKNLPIWGLYSTADKVVPAQWGRDFMSWIDSRNSKYAGQTKLTVWSDVSHNSTWGRAFNPVTKVDGYNIYAWMLLHKRGAGYTPGPDPSPSPEPTPTPTPTPTPVPSGSNKIPLANAGGDKTIDLKSGINRVTLNGSSSSDPDGTIASYTWTKVSGPSCTMMRYTSNQTYAAHLEKGTYVFKLTVKDNKGATSSDNITVNVVYGSGSGKPTPGPSAGNKAPVARAGGDRTIYLNTGINRVTLNGGSSSDADGSIVSYKWTKVSGPYNTMMKLNTTQTYSAHMIKGTYTFKLTVTDNKGATATDNITIYVK